MGCSKQTTSESGGTGNSVINLDYNIEKKEDKNEAIDVSDFNLGDGTIVDPTGRNVSYKIRGTMAAPKEEGKYPVVIIGHGSHSGSSADRFDNGFQYLVESIAKQGYIALSMDIQKQFTLDDGEPHWIERTDSIYREHIAKLKEANEGKNVGHNIDLKGKIDLDNQIFIGHSRSGQDMLLLADRLKQEGNDSVKGMISIAPSQVYYVSKVGDEEREPTSEYYADIPTGFIIPEYDGDVATLDGLTIYDKILNEDTARKSWMSAVLLKGGKHNFFNTLLKEDTVFLDPETVIVNKLNEEEHRDFIVNYTIDFLNAVVNKETDNTIFDLDSPTANKMYGYDVITKLDAPTANSVDLVDTKKAESIKGDKVQVEATVEHWIPMNDKIGAFRDPRLSNPIELLSLTWDEKGSNATIEVQNNKDFSKYESLSLQLTQNPINKANKVDVNQGFTLVVKDNKGKESKVVIGTDNTVLEYIPGKVIGDEQYPYYSNYNIIGEIRIPMSYFKNIDLTNAQSLSFIFDQTDSGNIVIENIQLK